MEGLVQKYIDKIEHAIQYGNDVLTDPLFMRTKLNNVILLYRGLSSKENRILINEIVDSDTCYLEIGVGRGTMFVPALYKNNPKYAVCIDDYGGSIFADDEKKRFFDFAQTFNIKESVDFHLIQNDCFRLNNENKKILSKEKFNVYFYDASRTFDNYVKSITHFHEYMDDVFILIVDDYSDPAAVDGIKIGIEKSNLKILREWKLGHNMLIKSETELSWHNGLYIAILQK